MKKAEWIYILPIAALALAGCEQKSNGQARTESRAESIGKQAPSSPSGAPVDSAAEGAKPEPSSRRYLGLKVGTYDIFVLKVADSKTLPAGKFLGKDDFAGKAKRIREPAFLVHILVPSSAKGIRLSAETGGKTVPLIPPALIYRMPNSPLRTYAILRGGSAAKLVGVAADGTSGSLDLGNGLARIQAMEFYWTSSDSGYLDYDDLPSSLYGSLGR